MPVEGGRQARGVRAPAPTPADTHTVSLTPRRWTRSSDERRRRGGQAGQCAGLLRAFNLFIGRARQQIVPARPRPQAGKRWHTGFREAPQKTEHMTYCTRCSVVVAQPVQNGCSAQILDAAAQRH